MTEHPGLHPASSGLRRAPDPLNDPIDPADLLPLDPPGDPALWERDRHGDHPADPWLAGPSTGDTPVIGAADPGPVISAVPVDAPAAHAIPEPPAAGGWLSPPGESGVVGPAHTGEFPADQTQHSPWYPPPLDAPPPEPPVQFFAGPEGHPLQPSPDGQHPAIPSNGAPTVAGGPAGPGGHLPPAMPTGPLPAIVASGLQKRFGEHVAVADVTFSVAKGTILGLLGPNGAGKTTTVNMLCTLLKPDGGTGSVAGHDIAGDPAGVRRSIMLTGQFAALDEALTGRENLILFGRLLGLSKTAARARADELLTSFGLAEAAGRRVREYSGGMRRRIDIACGLVTRPEVVFLDEPTTGLDPRSRQEVWQLVEQLRDQGVTILLTTQYLEEADALADQIVVIDHGRVIAGGTADELKSALGASYYEVTPTDPGDSVRVREVLADLLPPDRVAEPAALSVTVPAPEGADTLVDIVRRTSEAGIRLADVALRRPTLDEVFLALTDPASARGTQRTDVAEQDSPTEPILGTPIR